MLRRYARTRSVSNGAIAGESGIPTAKPPGMEVYEKHVQEMTKLLDDSQKKIDQVCAILFLLRSFEFDLVNDAG